MEKKSEVKEEQKNLEYMVEFEEGIRANVIIYGINHESGELYGADVNLRLQTKSGNSDVKIEVDNQITESVKYNDYGVKISCVVHKYKAPIPEGKNWEQEMHKEVKNQGWNCIRVQDPEHVRTAIDRHIELYLDPLNNLVNGFLDMFKETVKNHPNYRDVNSDPVTQGSK